MFGCLEVPHPQRLVMRARHGAAPVGRDRQGTDRVRMAFERTQALSALEVPHPQRLVIRARHGAAPIGRDRHGTDPAPTMAFEREQ